ncbi:hypothetical protein [Pseudomonas amygdali]|uniref:hypothetical protein n=1 Tax=Pseudomonas amygdali TaxID=47877 RepID=UPI0006E6E4ED|nr:hypothetical protein [Pseudomonas amygdali]KPY55700.1 hypothetical protein ALO93_200080 [Pseudomonas amygdali pv. sesami]
MDLVARRAFEKRIIIATAEAVIAAGCSVSVVEGVKTFIADSTDPSAIDAALHESGEPSFRVKRVNDGELVEGWVDFVGGEGIEVTADESLKLHDVLESVNLLVKDLNAQQKEQDRLKLTRDYFETGCSCILTNKTLQPCPTDMADAEAVSFYELNCHCSRNYQHFGRKTK